MYYIYIEHTVNICTSPKPGLSITTNTEDLLSDLNSGYVVGTCNLACEDLIQLKHELDLLDTQDAENLSRHIEVFIYERD